MVRFLELSSATSDPWIAELFAMEYAHWEKSYYRAWELRMARLLD